MTLFILSQIAGIIALILSIISFQLKRKRDLLLLQTISNIFKALALILVGGLSGALNQLVGMLRKFWFFKNSNASKKNSIYSLIFFSLLAVIVSIVSLENLFGLLPLVAVVLVTYGLWQDDIFKLRWFSMAGNIGFGIYSVIVGAYTNALSELVGLIAIITGLIHLYIQKKQNKL